MVKRISFLWFLYFSSAIYSLIGGSTYYREKYNIFFIQNHNRNIIFCNFLACLIFTMLICFFIYDYKIAKKHALLVYFVNFIAISCITPFVGLATICIFRLEW